MTRRLIAGTVLTAAILVGGAVSASAEHVAGTAKQVINNERRGDVVKTFADGTVVRNTSAASDMMRVTLTAAEYRTKVRVDMIDVTQKFRRTGCRFNARFTGDRGEHFDLRFRFSTNGWSGSGSGSGDVFYDCSFPKLRMSNAQDFGSVSVLNDCFENADEVKAFVSNSYQFTTDAFARDTSGTRFVEVG